MNTIILVEDDPLQRELLEAELTEEFPQIEIKVVTTESDFVAELPKLAALQPKIVVIDVMLLWAYPGIDAPKSPADYKGFARAGLRCLDLWLKTESKAKILIHSVIPEADIMADVQGLKDCFTYVAKDDEGQALVQAINQALRSSR